jgi:hypothetical protein
MPGRAPCAGMRTGYATEGTLIDEPDQVIGRLSCELACLIDRRVPTCEEEVAFSAVLQDLRTLPAPGALMCFPMTPGCRRSSVCMNCRGGSGRLPPTLTLPISAWVSQANEALYGAFPDHAAPSLPPLPRTRTFEKQLATTPKVI